MELGAQTNSQPGMQGRVKTKPKSVMIQKIANGYLISPQGIYPIGESVTYIASLENIAEACKEIFDTEL